MNTESAAKKRKHPIILFIHKLGSPPWFYGFAGKLIPWLWALFGVLAAWGLA